MAESGLTLKRDDLLKAIGNLLGKGMDITNWNDADFTARVNACVDIGCRMVYEPDILPNEFQVHIWSFMQPKLMAFALNGPYSTGTVTVAAGVVTGSGTNFPAWAADAELIVDGVSYPVATRNSGTSLTLEDTSVAAAAGSSFTLIQIDYVLPELFGGFLGDLVLNKTNTALGYTLERGSKEELLSLQKSGVADFASQPCRFAIFTRDQTGESDQRSLLTVWPLPDNGYTLSGFYIINPYRLTSALPYPMGGLPLSECLREACLAAAELEFMGTAGIHMQLFMNRLRAAVSFDRQANNPGILGQNLDQSYERDSFFRNGRRVIHAGLGPQLYRG